MGSSLDENPIRQVIDIVHEAEVETGKEKLSKPKLSENIGTGSVVKEEIRSQHSEVTPENASEKKVRLLYVSIPFG